MLLHPHPDIDSAWPKAQQYAGQIINQRRLCPGLKVSPLRITVLIRPPKSPLTQRHVFTVTTVVTDPVTNFSVLCWLQGAWLLVLFDASHAIEHNVTRRAQGSMASLQESPQSAWLMATAPDGSPAGGELQRIDRNDVRLGDLIYVKAGEQVGSWPLQGSAG